MSKVPPARMLLQKAWQLFEYWFQVFRVVVEDDLATGIRVARWKTRHLSPHRATRLLEGLDVGCDTVREEFGRISLSKGWKCGAWSV